MCVLVTTVHLVSRFRGTRSISTVTGKGERRDRTLEATTGLTQGCVKMDQSLRPTGTDFGER